LIFHWTSTILNVVTCLTHRAILLSSGITIRYGPSFSPSGFPQESQQGLFIISVNAGSELRQRNDSPTAINCFLEQTVCEPLAVHGFAKVTPAFSRTLFGVTLKDGTRKVRPARSPG